MNETTAKSSFWRRLWVEEPWPKVLLEALLTPFHALSDTAFARRIKTPLEDRPYRTRLIVCALVLLAAVVIINGVFNPLELLVNLPGYDSLDFYNAYSSNGAPTNWQEYLFASFFSIYYAVVAVISGLIAKGLVDLVFHGESHHVLEQRSLCGKGLGLWIVLLLSGSVATSLSQWVYKTFTYRYGASMENMTTQMNVDPTAFLRAVGSVFPVLLLMLFLLYFCIDDDFMRTITAPIAVLILQLDLLSFIPSKTLQLLIVTGIVALVSSLVQKTGLLEARKKRVIKWVYTLRNLVILLFLPFYILHRIFRGGKRARR